MSSELVVYPYTMSSTDGSLGGFVTVDQDCLITHSGMDYLCERHNRPTVYLRDQNVILHMDDESECF